MPERPRVDIGPKAYRAYRSGRRLVIRFYVAQATHRAPRGAYLFGKGPWFVWDMDSRGIAGKTSKTGYPVKKDAIRVARKYRDTYGAYTKAPF